MLQNTVNNYKKKGVIFTLIILFTLSFTASAGYTYIKDSYKWRAAVIVGMISYYGSYCEDASPPKHRKLQIKIVEKAFNVNREDVFFITVDILSTDEFERGMKVVKAQGCYQSKKQLDKIANGFGITGLEPPQYVSEETQNKIIQFFLDLIGK